MSSNYERLGRAAYEEYQRLTFGEVAGLSSLPPGKQGRGPLSWDELERVNGVSRVQEIWKAVAVAVVQERNAVLGAAVRSVEIVEAAKPHAVSER